MFFPFKLNLFYSRRELEKEIKILNYLIVIKKRSRLKKKLGNIFCLYMYI